MSKLRGPVGSVATAAGFTDAISGELLLCAKLSKDQIAEWNGEVVAITVAPSAGDNAPGRNFDGMTKRELESLAREKGVELDRRRTKKSLLETVKGLFS